MELTTYDAYGRPKSSVQTILGSVVAETVMGTSSVNGPTDALTVTVEGDGVTPVIVEWQAIGFTTGGASTNVYCLLRDGAGNTGTLYGSSYVSTPAASYNLNLSGQSRVIYPWTGSKTFYLYFTGSAGTNTLYGTSLNVINFLRVRRAHVHTLGTNPTNQMAYTAATLQNSWTNYGTWHDAQYFKTPHGVVHLTGLVADAAATSGEAIFTLPVGFRPLKPHIFGCNANGTYVRIDVTTAGVVQWQGPTGAVAWVTLAGINFLAEQ